MAANQLGEFEFVAFHHPQDHGAPPLLALRQGELVQRAGVDGSYVQRLGVKGRPFQMRSGVDVLSLSAGTDLLRDYMESASSDPLDLIWASVDYFSRYRTRYIVLDVEPGRVRKVTGAAGGLLAGAGTAWVDALWTLVPIRIAGE